MFTKLSASTKGNPAIGWGIFIVALIAVFLLGLLASSITERKAETTRLFDNQRVAVAKYETRSDQWGKNFPRQHDTWLKTSETDFRTKHLGSVKESTLAHRPDMVVLWAGYPFMKDYSTPRGHMYAIDDMRVSLRPATPTKEGDGPLPATCWSCKSYDVIRMMNQYSNAGDEVTQAGVDAFFMKQWGDMGPEVVNPIGCGTCHEEQNYNLKVAQPALIQAQERRGLPIDKATNQEMRSLVCAQCHVEYYFKPGTRELIFPWVKDKVAGSLDGISMEAMEVYFDSEATLFDDWTHKISGAKMLKAQHPDYELHLMGTHGKRDISCADCHMPYVSEGGVKFSDHQISSPLRNISQTCGTCHRDSEEKLKEYVYFNQDKVAEIRNRAEPELTKAHIMTGEAMKAGATAEELAATRKLLRQAQWRWDFGVASHGASFHAPVETQRVLALALDKSLQAQMEIQKVLNKYNVAFVMPDITTREKASAFIGIDLPKLQDEKEEWLKTTVPQWLDKADKAGILDPDVPKTTVYVRGL